MATPSPVFPAAIATDAQLKVANNLIQTTLRVAVDGVNTILFVASAAGFTPNCLVSIDKEIVAIADVVTSPNPALLVATGGRGFDGTSAAAHGAGAKVAMFIDAWHHNALASEIKAIEAALGPNLGNVGGGARVYDAAKYAFSAQSPGGSLIAGSNSITLAPVPPGVNGTDVNHWLYISGGTGTPEAVKITGGSAVAGAASGTLIFTCANAHSGAWTIGTATGGGAEANQALNTGGGAGIVRFTTVVTFHQGIYATASTERTVFQGLGLLTLLIIRGTDYLNGDLFHNSAGAAWSIQNLGINQSLGVTQSGAAVYIGPGQVSMDHVTIFGGQYGVRLFGAVSTNLNDVYYTNTDMSFKATAGLAIENLCINIFVSNSAFGGRGTDPNHPYADPNIVANGLRLLSADGVWIVNTVFSADTGILISPVASYIANVYIAGGGVDGTTNYCLAISGSGQPIQGIFLTGVHLNTQSDGSTYGNAPAIYIGAETTSWFDNFVMTGGSIGGSGSGGVYMGATGTRHVVFNGVDIHDNNRYNASSIGGMVFVTGVTGVTIANCTIGNDAGGFGHQKYAIANLGTMNAVITGNNLTNNEIGPVSIATFTGVMANNLGIDNLIPAVPSGASVTFPVNPRFTITGTTGVTSVSVPLAAGAGGTFRTTDGAVTFTAGASIGNTLTTTQNVPVVWTWDGTKVWLK